ncbi:PEP-CTERM/exosortase system-associated acyltransferase [Parahaliea mediterranea]|uniref:PEP-CTERM/exosortase system-associated acyltransferase n=1 Tax=Parahaliea mediterranea TaxID=651086 RepID=A0A939DHB1_9GAMM|nr:PEP-CTERM/exosortase system-associated acyltransferase [Parahaliea mediterranea]MBN7797472.1 PEP-CTERM/exosortase system-associated acyltransferase [Parahaliea mediterranea]
MGELKDSLVKDFQRYFGVELATSQSQLDETFAVRYRVYCEEFAYEPKDRFPQALERDDFDDRSWHCLVRHRGTGLAAGCVRLVYCNQGDDLPLERFCREAVAAGDLAELERSRSVAAEVSRLAVDGRFRRRPGEDATRYGHLTALDVSHREARTFSLVAVAAYLSACAVAALDGREVVYAMMEPFLPRLLKRSGIYFNPAGQEVDYHGLRAPYMIRTEDALGSMLPDLRSLYQAIEDEFSAEFKPAVAGAPGVRPQGRRAAREWRQRVASALSFPGVRAPCCD